MPIRSWSAYRPKEFEQSTGVPFVVLGPFFLASAHEKIGFFVRKQEITARAVKVTEVRLYFSARTCDGALAIESRPGTETTVRARMP